MEKELYAFPHEKEQQWKGSQGTYTEKVPQAGMTLRDYFAAQAMQGMVTSCGNWHEFYMQATPIAYKIADAMLKARNKNNAG